MFSLADTNPTQITGVLAFAMSTTACVVAARRAHGRAATAWKLLALLQCAFVLEIVFGLRHQIHDVVDAFLQDRGWYAQRQPVQMGLLVAGLVAAVAGFVALLRWGRAHPAVAPAALASFTVLLLFGLEMVSLHAIDAVLYARVGPLMLIALLWAACAAVVAARGLKRR